MSYQLEDYVPPFKIRETMAHNERVDQLRYQVGVAEKMSELQADPRWAIYGNHLETVKAEYERMVKAARDKITGREFLSPEKYGQIKFDLAEADGVVKGIQIALDLAKTLVERGKIASQEVNAEDKRNR